MRKKNIILIAVLGIILVLVGGSNCSRPDKEILYESGLFPEVVQNLSGINSVYDDYNIAYYQIGGELKILFSSNRASMGGEFDFVSGSIFCVFDQTNGSFTFDEQIIGGPPFTDIQNAVNTSDNQFGPFPYFNSTNGLEYFFYAEDSQSASLDIMFTSYTPTYYGDPPILGGIFPVSAVNSTFNDAYPCIDWDFSKLYFTTDRTGNYDISETDIEFSTSFDEWLKGELQTVVPTDSINSSSDDKCPFISGNIMVFTSDRPGGLGGFDLYYSLYINDKWSSPVNFGPTVNTEYNEYRPIVGFLNGFTNYFMIFSSDRPEGLGEFDLYFTGVSFD